MMSGLFPRGCESFVMKEGLGYESIELTSSTFESTRVGFSCSSVGTNFCKNLNLNLTLVPCP